MAAFFKQFGAVEHRDAWYKDNLNPEIEKLKKDINFENLDRESLETANLNPDALRTLAAINTINVKTNHLYRLHLSKNYKNLPEDEKKSYDKLAKETYDEITNLYCNKQHDEKKVSDKDIKQLDLSKLSDDDKKMLGLNSNTFGVHGGKTMTEMLYESVKESFETGYDGMSELDDLRLKPRNLKHWNSSH